jgi:hypothetical protein
MWGGRMLNAEARKRERKAQRKGFNAKMQRGKDAKG